MIFAGISHIGGCPSPAQPFPGAFDPGLLACRRDNRHLHELTECGERFDGVVQSSGDSLSDDRGLPLM